MYIQTCEKWSIPLHFKEQYFIHEYVNILSKKINKMSNRLNHQTTCC